MPAELRIPHRPEGVEVFNAFLDTYRCEAGEHFENSDHSALLRGILFRIVSLGIVGFEDIDSLLRFIPAGDFVEADLFPDYSPETNHIFDNAPPDYAFPPRVYLESKIRDVEWAQRSQGWSRSSAIGWKAYYRTANFLGELANDDYDFIASKIPAIDFEQGLSPFEVFERVLKSSPLVRLPRIYAGRPQLP